MIRGRRTKPSPSSLLVLRLDAEQLAIDGLSLANETEFISTLAKAGIGAKTQIISATDRTDLLGKLAEAALQHLDFDVVVVIAHSNATGIRLASDEFVSWSAFAGYLHPFGPRRLGLVACKAGSWPAAKTLFRELPGLRRIFASPSNVGRDFGQWLLLIMPFIAARRSAPRDFMAFARLGSLLLTRQQLLEWKREKAGAGCDIFDELVEIATKVVNAKLA